MGKHLEDDDAKTCAEFWDHLARAGRLPEHDEHDKAEQVKCFLRERAERREAGFNRPPLAQD